MQLQFAADCMKNDIIGQIKVHTRDAEFDEDFDEFVCLGIASILFECFVHDFSLRVDT